MSRQPAPPPPARELLDSQAEHFALYQSIREAIATLPVYFRTETHISGVMATDLHTLNTVLAATIEEQRVQETVDIPSAKAQAALAIVAELERLLDLPS